MVKKSEEKKVKVASIVRESLSVLGLDASTKEIKEWIAQTYPGLTINQATFGATLSLIRKQAGVSTNSNGGRPSLRQSSDAMKTINLPMLLAVKKAANELNGLNNLRSQVDRVASLVCQVGSLEKLTLTIECLEQLLPATKK